ncbi:hypothetical protein SFR_6682 [Streptomyces sp. FR-008]|nr:hypothetical protein SFR_6682 [Streptomyces sp. FR-008]
MRREARRVGRGVRACPDHYIGCPDPSIAAAVGTLLQCTLQVSLA